MSYYKLRGTLAQILILVILLPFLAVILRLIAPSGGKLAVFAASALDDIPLFKMWTSLIGDIAGKSLDADFALNIFTYAASFVETILTAAVVHICNSIFRALKCKGLPILPTFAGVILSTVIILLTGNAENEIATLAMDFVVIAVMIMGVKFMFKGVFSNMNVFPLKKIILFIIDGLAAVICCGYTTMIAIFWCGRSLNNPIFVVIAMSLITIVALCIHWWVSKAVEKDLGW